MCGKVAEKRASFIVEVRRLVYEQLNISNSDLFINKMIRDAKMSLHVRTCTCIYNSSLQFDAVLRHSAGAKMSESE